MSFVNLVRRNVAEATKLSDAQGRELLSLLRDLRDRIQARATDPNNSPIDAFTIARVDGETKAAIQALELKSRGLYQGAAKEQAEAAVEHVSTELGSLSSKVGEKVFGVVPDAAYALADPSQALLANHFETSLARYGGDLLNKVRRDLFVGIRTGQPVNDMVRGLVGQRGALGTVSEDAARRLIRTETSNAYGAAVHNSIDQLAQKVPGIRKTWVHIGSYPCPVCIPLDGSSRPMDGSWTIKSGKKTFKVVHPPAHPHCTCRAVASKPTWDKAIDKLGYGKH